MSRRPAPPRMRCGHDSAVRCFQPSRLRRARTARRGGAPRSPARCTALRRRQKRSGRRRVARPHAARPLGCDASPPRILEPRAAAPSPRASFSPSRQAAYPELVRTPQRDRARTRMPVNLLTQSTERSGEATPPGAAAEDPCREIHRVEAAIPIGSQLRRPCNR